MSRWTKARLVEPQDWPHREVHAVDDGARLRRIDVGAGHEGILAAQLQRHRLDAAGACMTLRPVAMLPTSPIMSTSGLSAAPASPPPGSMASTPGGSRSPISSAQRSADSGACAGGLMMTALPAARRGQLAHGEQQRMIERHDARDHAQRLALGVVQDVRPHRDGVALQLRHQPGEEVQQRGGHHDVRAHLAHRIAAVQRIQQGQLGGIVAQPLTRRSTARASGAVAPDGMAFRARAAGPHPRGRPRPRASAARPCPARGPPSSGRTVARAAPP